jgi:hypothetical protein
MTSLHPPKIFWANDPNIHIARFKPRYDILVSAHHAIDLATPCVLNDQNSFWHWRC